MFGPSLGLDLSYLTDDERRIIDNVLRRQKEEEERNGLILRNLQEDYDRIAQAVRHRLESGHFDSADHTLPNEIGNSYPPSSFVDRSSMCQICRIHVPDIPIEGIRLAHCHYCGLRVCYRCGTTLTYKAKTVWTCAVCKKRHELLVKTGQWATSKDFDDSCTNIPFRARTRSRSQEPHPLIVTNRHNVSRVTHGQVVPLPGQPLDLRRHISASTAHLESDMSWANGGQEPFSPTLPHRATVTNLACEESWQNCEVAERSRPNSTVSFNQMNAAGFDGAADIMSPPATLPRQSSHRAHSLPRSLENLHIMSDLPDKRPVRMVHNYSEAAFSQHHHDMQDPVNRETVFLTNGRTASSLSIQQQPPSTPVFSIGGRCAALRRGRMASMHQDSLSSEVSSDFGGGMAHSSSSTSYNLNMVGNTSVPPLMMNPSHQAGSLAPKRRSYFGQCPQTSISSSEDDMRSTPDCLTESDLEFEVESASVSERGDMDSYRSGPESGGEGWRPGSSRALIQPNGSLPLGAMSGSGVVDPLACGKIQQPPPSQFRGSPSNGVTFRPKAVRFQRNSSVDCGVVAGPTTRDSGLETASSTQTLNEDGSKFRMDWQKSADGSKLIGKFSILRNNRGESNSRILGLKVVGGRLADNGQLGAIVTKVKRGSVADVVGRLRPGDEVMEWNGVPLQGLSFEQVFEVMASMRDVRRLDLIVQRSVLHRLPDEIGPCQAGDAAATHRSAILSSRRHSTVITTGHQPFSIQLSAQSSRPETEIDAGRLQLRLWHDTVRSELIITVVSARDLLPIGISAITSEPPPEAFCVVSLVPQETTTNGLSSEVHKKTPVQSRRWTNRHPASWEPRWDQTFSMWPVSGSSNVSLDVAVYDAQPPDGYCDGGSTCSRCIGFVTLALNEVPLNNEPYWYRLAKPEAGARDGPGIVPPPMTGATKQPMMCTCNQPASCTCYLVDESTIKTTPFNGGYLKQQLTVQQDQQPTSTTSGPPPTVAQQQQPQLNGFFPSQQPQSAWQMPQQDQTTSAYPPQSVSSSQPYQSNVTSPVLSQPSVAVPGQQNQQQQQQQQQQQPQQFINQSMFPTAVDPSQPCVGMPPTFQQSSDVPPMPPMQPMQPLDPTGMQQTQQQTFRQPQQQFGMQPQQLTAAAATFPPQPQPLQQFDQNQSTFNTNIPLPSQTVQQPQQQQFGLQQTQPIFPLAPVTQMPPPEQLLGMQQQPPLQQQQQQSVSSLGLPQQPLPNTPAIFSQPQQPYQTIPDQPLSTFPVQSQQQQPLSTIHTQPVLPALPSMPIQSQQQQQLQPSFSSQPVLPMTSIALPLSVSTMSQQPLFPSQTPPLSQHQPPVPLQPAPVLPQTVMTPKPIPPSALPTTSSMTETHLPEVKSTSFGDLLKNDETGSDLGDDGHMYRKHSQSGMVAQPSSSLGRRVARYRSDASSSMNGLGSTSSIGSNDTLPPEVPPAGTIPSQPLPVEPTVLAATRASETPPPKRHVRLAPEVSFIEGDDPPISLPLAVDSPIVDEEPSLSVVSKAVMMDSAAEKPPVDPDKKPTPILSRRSSQASVSSIGTIGTLPRQASVGESSDGDSTTGSGLAMVRNTSRSHVSLSESEMAAGGYSSGGDGTASDGGASQNDPAVLAQRLQKKSLWGSAAKKSLIKLTGKSAFPNVVDSVLAQNMAKQKKKGGINRCGDEVVISASSGFDMTAGFFDDANLGPGQVMGRQMLGATAIGEMEIGLREDSGHLTVTLVAARDLMFKNKPAPSVYAKSALVVGQSTQERLKSVPQQVKDKDCDPQLGIEFAFQSSPFRDKMLQTSLWAAYGRMTSRHCLGAVAIKLEEITRFPIRATYKLYDPGTVGGFVQSIALEGPAVPLL